MITRERLEELIKQEKGCYILANTYTIGYIHLDGKYEPKIEETEDNNYNLWVFTSNDFDFRDCIHDYSLFETKEEALFVLKYHKTKTLCFEPPTFEEFLKTGDDKRLPHWDCDDISIIEWTDENRFLVDMYGDGDFDKFFYYGNDDWKDNRKEAYCKAVEYAMKLFLGEEV